GFLQTPPLASDALAIQIVFPLVGVTLLSCKQTGLPALLGKQKRVDLIDPFHLISLAEFVNDCVSLFFSLAYFGVFFTLSWTKDALYNNEE
ncbi:hypothetical protein ERW51_12400, partial [Aliivibrio finisterrensis]